MSDDAFHAPIPHVHDPVADLGDDEAADETPPGGFMSGDDRLREHNRGDDGGVIPVDAPVSPDL
jgi:hypothetical protein